MPTLGPTAASTADADRAALHTTASGVPNEHVSRLRHSFCSSSCSTTTTSSWRSNHHAGATSCTRSSNGGLQHAPARAMTMFIITDGNNNVSRDKPVEHIDMVIGLHVSACTSCTRTMRVRRDIAIDITESVQLLVRFNALRSMPVMPKLEHYNQNAMRSMAAAALATQAAAANARARPRLAGQCEKWLARPNTQRAKPALGRPPPSPCPHTRPHSCPHKRPHARPHSRTRGLVRLRKCPLVFTPGTRACACGTEGRENCVTGRRRLVIAIPHGLDSQRVARGSVAGS